MRPIRLFLCVGLLWAGLAVSAAAHQGEVHGKPSAKASAKAQPLASPGQVVPSPVDELDMSAVTPAAIASKLPRPVQLQELDWADSMMGHVHNKLVHFPLALGLAASLLWVLALRQPGHEPAARLLLVGAALMGVASVLTGESQKGVYDDSPLIDIVGWHEKMGFVSLGLLLLGAGWQWHKSWRKVVWAYGLLLVGMILFTGLLGGVVSHGHLEPAEGEPTQAGQAPSEHAPGGHE